MNSEAEICAQLAASGIFDSDWYLKAYPDVAASGIDPLFHYVRYGRNEGRECSATGSMSKDSKRQNISTAFTQEKTATIPVTVTMCTNETYAPVLSVVLESLKSNASPQTTYTICILYNDLAPSTIDFLESQTTDNIRVTTYCSAKESANLLSQATEIRYISRETWFRLLIPELFSDYFRCVYLDCDIIVNEDISRLFWMDLNHNPLGAVRDNWMIPSSMPYRKKLLGNDYKSYFNAGILLMDIPRIREVGSNKQCFDLMYEAHTCLNVDQDILNRVYLNKTEFLPMTWNFGWQAYVKDGYKYFSLDEFKEFADCFKKPAIVHYVSDLKPWNYNDGYFTAMFWRYARTSPFLDKMIAACTFDLEPVWEQIDSMEF